MVTDLAFSIGSMANACFALVPASIISVKGMLDKLRVDSRVKSFEWILNNFSIDSVMLLDDYGPILQPNTITASRLFTELKKSY